MIFISKLVETQNIRINEITQNKDGFFTNEIVLTPDKELLTKTLSAESELHRILLHLSGDKQTNKSGREIVPYLFTLDVGKDQKRYKSLITNDGRVRIRRQVGDTEEITEYVSEFCGASHSRTQKNLFVDVRIKDKLDDILLCGIPKNLTYSKPSKWNAYFALVTTDSTPVSYMPNIVVVDDFNKSVRDMVEVVKVTGTGSSKQYIVLPEEERDIEILPFDGAGLVTPECATYWAEELKCTCKKTGKPYLPSCFQFRCLPALKGELFVFDLYQFAKEHGVSKIIDIGGKEWDLFTDQIDVIMTKSQFKFWNLYLDKNGKFDYMMWRNAFSDKVHGYTRTFNISAYADAPEDLKQTTMLSYQPLQTLDFTGEENQDAVKAMVADSTEIYEKAVSNVQEFLQYRGVVRIDEKGEKLPIINDLTPPYYEALLYCPQLAHDAYIRDKMQEDMKRLKNDLLSGKQIVHGNYQTLAPDIYGLAEYALGLEVRGLLPKPFQVYSNYWMQQGVKEVDVIRNPHIYMEHRLASVVSDEECKKWYSYQNETIVTGMYDTMAYALGTADFDGDTVCTTNNIHIISAVRCEIDKGNAHLIIKDGESSGGYSGINISDVPGLMRINAMSFKNNIGTVIDKVTNFWSMVNEYEKARDYIKIGVIVGEETIDFAKTGQNAAFPKEVTSFIKGKKKGYWMRYLKKNQDTAQKEELSVKKAKQYNQEADYTRFMDYDCTMNTLCKCAEQEINDIECTWYKDDFDYTTLLYNKEQKFDEQVYKRLCKLQSQYADLSKLCRNRLSYKDKREIKNVALHYRMFYEQCRIELLYLLPDINSLLDVLILIYYTMPEYKNGKKSKDILWNAFGRELIDRCKGVEVRQQVDKELIQEKHKQVAAYEKKRTRTPKVYIKSLNTPETADRVVSITTEERKIIKKMIVQDAKIPIKTRANVTKIQRIFAVLLYLSRKFESIAEHTRTVKIDGKYVKDENGKNLKESYLIYSSKPIRIKNNVQNEINYSKIATLAGVNDNYVDIALQWLYKSELIDVVVCNDGDIKVTVLFDRKDGRQWISTPDINDAAVKIRDYYR